MMDGSLRALLEGLIDYAGLFPPTGLDMERAARSFISYRSGTESWMLARFVMPAVRKAELIAALPPNADPLELSVLARSDALREDASLLPAGAFEVRLPTELIAKRDAKAVAAWIVKARGELRGANCAEAMLFLEAGPPEALQAIVGGIAAAGDRRVGYKIRSGGLEPAAFPTSQDIATTVLACRDAGVPFKATAGLHHPIRHWNEEIGVRMHGFINVFGGAVLAVEHELDARELARILDDENPRSWRFKDGALQWRDLAATAETVRQTRRELAISFGSCSFDEPRDDLRALKLLPKTSPIH